MAIENSKQPELPAKQQAIRAKCFHPSGTFVEFPKGDIDTSIPARLEKIARAYPDRIAFKTKERQFTYAELNRRANCLAHFILEKRGTEQEPVALFLDLWEGLVIAHLGVLKCGKFSLAVDPAADVQRILHLLGDSGARTVIADENSIDRARKLAPGECELINLDDLEISRCGDNPDIEVSPQAYAYIRYTSGSTGNAKGALKTHRHVLKAVMDFTNHFHICPEDRVALLGFASIGKHLFKALLTGAVLCPFDPRREGLVDLAEWMRREQTTIYYSFPTAFRHFAGALSGAESLPDLRLIELEGEPVYKSDVDLFRNRFSPRCLMVNTLSSAETGTVCLYFIDHEIALEDGQVPVGYPVADVEVFVLDDAGHRVAGDHVGEIAVRSRFLADGYWQKPDVTSKKFFAQAEDGSDRYYLSGDLGRVSEDGCIHLLGRKDFQVKI